MAKVLLVEPGGATSTSAAEIWELLRQVDHEFVPPLSARESTTTKTLSGGADVSSGPRVYFTGVLEQYTICVRSEGRLAGLLSFRARHHDDLVRDFTPCTYISTIAVDPQERGKGLGSELYRAVHQLPEHIASPYLVTRTWSSNDKNIPVLKHFGYKEVVRMPDHRGPGVDTLYYMRPSTNTRSGHR